MYGSPACGCTLTLKLTEQPQEREKRFWTVPADFRNKNDAKVAVVQLSFEQGAIEFLRFRGEPPPEGYKVELPAPRESRKAKRKAADGAENEVEGTKKKSKLLSQAEQFLVSTFPTKPTPARASGSSQTRSRRSTTSTPVMFLPRPGYIDPKPEPGELPAEPPTDQPKHLPANPNRPSRPAAQPFSQMPGYPLRHAADPSYSSRLRGEPRPAPYDGSEQGRQYELDD